MEGAEGPAQGPSSLGSVASQPGGGRPPLPAALRSSAAPSLNSSRVSSPRGSLSAQHSLQTLSALKLAQYRAGARTFREDREPRPGLSSGDVVAFQAQEGVFAVHAQEAGSEDPAAVHYGFSCSGGHVTTEPLTHLEVVKQGKWLAFRSAAAGDRFLQARKRSPRLVFFSTNIGTWEQWELAEGPAEEGGAAWAQHAVTLRHRRLPQFELRVELVRVGACSLVGAGASITTRSLAVVPHDAEPSENVQLRKMSGVLMHEWFNFVDREKQLRLNIAAQVGQLVEDAADLKAWTVTQVDTIRGEMDGEVTQLLEVIQRKSDRLEDAQSRLTNRLRWGIAVLQAKNEASIKRQVFGWWRGIAGRKKYCRHVVAKLQQRVDMRLAARALEGWLERHHEQRERQQRLWMAVRRMAFVKMFHAFASWRELVAAKQEAAAHYRQLTASAWAHMQRWRLQQVLAAWRARASACQQGRAMLERMAAQAQHRAAAAAFASWRQFVPQQQARVESLTALVAARQRHDVLQAAVAAWREAVDERHGRRMQLAHAQQVLGRLRQRLALRAWLAWQLQRAGRQHAWGQLLVGLQRRRLQRAFAAWQEEAACRRERREMLMRFVGERAMGMMHQAFELWREHTSQKREQAYILEQCVARLSHRLLAKGWAAWRQGFAEAKVQRHRVAVCRRRLQAGTLRAVLGAWRSWVGRRRAEEMIVQLGHRRSDRNRLAVAFRALAANVDQAQAQHEQAAVAVQHCAGQLQRRALAAWVEAVRSRRGFEQQLQAVHRGMQVQALRGALQGWRAAAQASIAERQRVEHARHRLGKLRLRAALQTWRGYTAYQQHLQAQLHTLVGRRAEQMTGAAFGGWRELVAERRSSTMRLWECTMRVSQLRMAWAFRAWQAEAAERAAAKTAVQGAERRINRIKAAAAFRAWREHTASMAQARVAAQQKAAARAAKLAQQCFYAWVDAAEQRADQQAAVMRFVHRRATLRMANVLLFWRAYVGHMAERRQQLQRACGKLRRVRLQQALAAWQQRAAERRAGSLALQAAQKKLQAKRQARFFRAWAEHASSMQQAREAAALLVKRSQGSQLAAAFNGWRDTVIVRRHARSLLGKLARRCDGQLLSSAFQAWRQQAQRAQHLQRLEGNLGAKRQLGQLIAAFQAWRQHAADLRSVRAAVNDRHRAEAAVLLRLTLRGWRGHTAQRQRHRWHILETCVTKQVVGLQSSAFSAWRQHTQARLRSEAVMLRAVDRLAMRVMRSAFEAWREAARARKARRTALARFMQRWQQQRLRGAFWQWQHALEERKAAEDNLRRCLIRKRVAFKLFRNWYWESFDDEMQETLRTMFEVTNEAAADPLPSRMGSPIHSLLSSPIRAQLGYDGRHQHQQLAAGVAQRLAGGLQPSYLRFDEAAAQPEGQLLPEGFAASVQLQFGLAGAGTVAAALRQPLPPQPAPLHRRVISARSSPVKAHSHVPAAPANLGGAILAPLRDYATSSLAHHPYGGDEHAAPAGHPLPSLPERYQPMPAAQQAATPGGLFPEDSRASSAAVSGSHSKVASTIVPRSPLTPSSAGYAGGATPLTHFATPNPDGLFTVNRVPGTVLGSAQRRQQAGAGAEGQAAAYAGSGASLSPRVLHSQAGSLGSPTHSVSSHPGAAPSPAYAARQRSPSSLSEAPTPGAGFGMYDPQPTPLSQARTPLPGGAGASPLGDALAGEPTPDPDLQGYRVSPGLLQQLASAATPPPPGLGVQQYSLKRMSGAGGAAPAQSGAATAHHSPLASLKTLDGFPELQGDYSIRRMEAVAAQEAAELEAQGTPDPDQFIAAYPGTMGRSAGRLLPEEALNAAKTPLSPLYVNPLCFDSPTRQPTELD